jgi:hypothetical protein
MRSSFKCAAIVLAAACIVAGPPAQASDSGKIERALLDRLAVSGTSDFIVVFGGQPDLSPALSMGWRERGEFVFNALRQTARRSQSTVTARLDADGVRYRSFIAGNELYVWNGDAALAAAIARRSEVSRIRAPQSAAIEPAFGVRPNQMTGRGDITWSVADTGAPHFWSSFANQGAGMVVAEMSTGVQWDHPALDQAFQCGADPSDPSCWHDPSQICGGSACDNVGYGTAMAGIMVGDDDPSLDWQAGMAPDARWIACKACESSSCSSFAINDCADWLLAPGGNPSDRPHVVVVPWGGGSGDPWLVAKVNAWRAAGIFPAVQAGNAGSCGSIGSPGDYQESFASAAHDSSRDLASFSAGGPSFFGHDPYTKPNISAPGVNICAPLPGDGWTCSQMGTGAAASHAAGAVALLWSCAPLLNGQANATFDALQQSADEPPPGDCGAPPDGEGNYRFGYGYLNVLAAGGAHCSGLPFSDGFESGDLSAWSRSVGSQPVP